MLTFFVENKNCLSQICIPFQNYIKFLKRIPYGTISKKWYAHTNIYKMYKTKLIFW